MRRRTIRDANGYVLVEPGRNAGHRVVVVGVEEGLHKSGVVRLRPGQARELAANLIECAEQLERFP